MSDKIPQRPEGLNPEAAGSQPRVQVEPTPFASEQPAGATSQLPYTPAVPEAERTQANPAQAGAQPATNPYVPSTSEAMSHTVVKTKTKKFPVFASAFGGLVVGGVLVVALAMTGAFDLDKIPGISSSSNSSSAQTIKIDSEDTTLAETVAAKALPSVVSITASTDTTSLGSQQGGESSSGSIGSGVVLDSDGNVLTNNHVIEGFNSIMVTMNDGSTYSAKLVGTDESSDLAVIKIQDIDASKLSPIEIGDSDKLTVGEWVMAIGSPFGNEQSVSTGIVSALYRSTALASSSGTSIYANMIQTDAAINPGNSGGALVNDNGELIGINSVIESYSGSSSGVGFAIPISYAKNIADQIIAGKTPEHPYMGVTVASVNALNARQNNLSVDSGAYISSVVEGGPAANAGIEKGDIVTAVDDTKVESADGLIIALRSYNVGDKVTLTVMRGSDEKKIEVTLGSDADTSTQQGDETTGSGVNNMSREELLQYLEQLLGRGSNN